MGSNTSSIRPSIVLVMVTMTFSCHIICPILGVLSILTVTMHQHDSTFGPKTPFPEYDHY